MRIVGIKRSSRNDAKFLWISDEPLLKERAEGVAILIHPCIKFDSVDVPKVTAENAAFRPRIELNDATDKSRRFDSMENSIQSWQRSLVI